jgi:uncharacterized DUF497 family protein
MRNLIESLRLFLFNSNDTFEYDRRKSMSNKKKHKISFFKARKLWNSRIIEDALPYSEELRYSAIGIISEKYWKVIFTYRGEKNDKIRIISVYRPHRNEEREYENNN